MKLASADILHATPIEEGYPLRYIDLLHIVAERTALLPPLVAPSKEPPCATRCLLVGNGKRVFLAAGDIRDDHACLPEEHQFGWHVLVGLFLAILAEATLAVQGTTPDEDSTVSRQC